MDYAAERTLPSEGKAAGKARSLWQIFRQYATPRVTAAAIIWRFESYTVTPMVILFIEAFGRWNGALAVGAVMAVYSALFLYLLDGEPALGALRGWLRERRMVQRFVLPIKRSEGLAGSAGRKLAAPASVMFLAAFERAVAYRVLALKNWVAYPLSVGGAFPRALFWAGLVFGSAWELVFRPALIWAWSQIAPVLGTILPSL
jgi:hypothetical protein